MSWWRIASLVVVALAGCERAGDRAAEKVIEKAIERERGKPARVELDRDEGTIRIVVDDEEDPDEGKPSD